MGLHSGSTKLKSCGVRRLLRYRDGRRFAHDMQARDASSVGFEDLELKVSISDFFADVRLSTKEPKDVSANGVKFITFEVAVDRGV